MNEQITWNSPDIRSNGVIELTANECDEVSGGGVPIFLGAVALGFAIGSRIWP